MAGTNAARPSVRSPVGFLIVGAGVLAALLQALNLLYLTTAHGCRPFELTCSSLRTVIVTADAPGFLNTAHNILQKGFLHATYLSRPPGFPLLLAFATRVTGDPLSVLWLVTLLAGLAAAATAWVAAVVSRRPWAAGVAGVLFCVWPSTYEFSPLIMSDASHGYLAVVAFALTLRWMQQASAWRGIAAAGAWAVTQSLRPTFFPLALILPILLLRRDGAVHRRSVAVAMWLLSCAVPASVVGSNYAHYHMVTASDRLAVNLSEYSVPRLKEDMGLGDFAALKQAARERYATIADLGERLAIEKREAWSFLAEHPWPAFRSFAKEGVGQMLSPLQPFYAPELRPFYPRWTVLPSFVLGIFWVSTAAGLLILASKDWQVALFLLGLFVLVMLPATTSHWVGARLRFPLDLLAIPLAVNAWLVAATWLSDVDTEGGSSERSTG
jgi:hypothetical protein